jgi:hypothetical protein
MRAVSSPLGRARVGVRRETAYGAPCCAGIVSGKRDEHLPTRVHGMSGLCPGGTHEGSRWEARRRAHPPERPALHFRAPAGAHELTASDRCFHESDIPLCGILRSANRLYRGFGVILMRPAGARNRFELHSGGCARPTCFPPATVIGPAGTSCVPATGVRLVRQILMCLDCVDFTHGYTASGSGPI